MKPLFINHGIARVELEDLFASENVKEQDRLFVFQKNKQFQYMEIDVSTGEGSNKKIIPVILDTNHELEFFGTYNVKLSSGIFSDAVFIGRFINGPSKDNLLYVRRVGKSIDYVVKSAMVISTFVRSYIVENPVNYHELTNQIIWDEFLLSLGTNKEAVERLSAALKVLQLINPKFMNLIIGKLFDANADQALKIVEHKSFQTFLSAFIQQSTPEERGFFRDRFIPLLFVFFPRKPELLVSYIDPASSNALHFLPDDIRSFTQQFISNSLQFGENVKVDPLRIALANKFINFDQIKIELQKLAQTLKKLDSNSKEAPKIQMIIDKFQNVVDLFSYMNDSTISETDFDNNIMTKAGMAVQSNPGLVFNHLLDIFKNLELFTELKWERYLKLITMLCFLHGKPSRPLHVHLVPIMSALLRFKLAEKPVPQLFENDAKKLDFINQKCPDLLQLIVEHNSDKNESETIANVNNNNRSEISSSSAAKLDLNAVEHLIMLLLLIRSESVGDPIDYIRQSILELREAVIKALESSQTAKMAAPKIDVDKKYIGILYRFRKLIGYVRENATDAGPIAVRLELLRLQDLQSGNIVEIVAGIIGRLHKLAVASKEFSTFTALTTVADSFWKLLGNEKIYKKVDIGNGQNILGAALDKPKQPIHQPKAKSSEPEQTTTEESQADNSISNSM